jgi:hypothetical protein
MEFNQSRITVADVALTPILDWIITEGSLVCKVVLEDRQAYRSDLIHSTKNTENAEKQRTTLGSLRLG